MEKFETMTMENENAAGAQVHTLDNAGNAWFAGSVSVGADGKPLAMADLTNVENAVFKAKADAAGVGSGDSSGSGSDGDGDGDNSGGVRTCRFVIGTSTAGWTEDDCDYLCDGVEDEVQIKTALDNLPEEGGEILLLDGTYHITKNNIVFPITKRKISITGTLCTTITNAIPTSTPYLDSGIITAHHHENDTDNILEDVLIKNICFKHERSNGYKAIVIFGYEFKNVEIENNYFLCENNIMLFISTDNHSIKNNYFEIVNDNPIEMYGCSIFQLENNMFDFTNVLNGMVYIQHSTRGTIKNNWFKNATSSRFIINESSCFDIASNRFDECVNAMRLETVSASYIHDNYFRYTGTETDKASIELNDVTKSKISNNFMIGQNILDNNESDTNVIENNFWREN